MYIKYTHHIVIWFQIFLSHKRKFPVIVVNVLDCEILVSEFNLQLRYHVHFRANTIEKGINPLIPPAIG